MMCPLATADSQTTRQPGEHHVSGKTERWYSGELLFARLEFGVHVRLQVWDLFTCHGIIDSR